MSEPYIEKRAGFDILVFDTGCRPASDVEAEWFATIAEQRATIEALNAQLHDWTDISEIQRTQIGQHTKRIVELERESARLQSEIAELRKAHNELVCALKGRAVSSLPPESQ